MEHVDPGHLPELGELSGSLRETWRLEQDAATADAVENFRHRRTLRELLVEVVNRGDQVAVEAAGRRFLGVITGVAEDLAVLRTQAGRIDLHLNPAVPLRISVAERVDRGGHRPEPTPSMRGRLLSLEAQGSMVEVGHVAGDEFTGVAVAGRLIVGVDHVVIERGDGRDEIIPMSSIAYFVTRSGER